MSNGWNGFAEVCTRQKPVLLPKAGKRPAESSSYRSAIHANWALAALCENCTIYYIMGTVYRRYALEVYYEFGIFSDGVAYAIAGTMPIHISIEKITRISNRNDFSSDRHMTNWNLLADPSIKVRAQKRHGRIN